MGTALHPSSDLFLDIHTSLCMCIVLSRDFIIQCLFPLRLWLYNIDFSRIVSMRSKRPSQALCGGCVEFDVLLPVGERRLVQPSRQISYAFGVAWLPNIGQATSPWTSMGEYCTTESLFQKNWEREGLVGQIVLVDSRSEDQCSSVNRAEHLYLGRWFRGSTIARAVGTALVTFDDPLHQFQAHPFLCHNLLEHERKAIAPQ